MPVVKISIVGHHLSTGVDFCFIGRSDKVLRSRFVIHKSFVFYFEFEIRVFAPSQRSLPVLLLSSGRQDTKIHPPPSIRHLFLTCRLPNVINTWILLASSSSSADYTTYLFHVVVVWCFFLLWRQSLRSRTLLLPSLLSLFLYFSKIFITPPYRWCFLLPIFFNLYFILHKFLHLSAAEMFHSLKNDRLHKRKRYHFYFISFFFVFNSGGKKFVHPDKRIRSDLVVKKKKSTSSFLDTVSFLVVVWIQVCCWWLLVIGRPQERQEYSIMWFSFSYLLSWLRFFPLPVFFFLFFFLVLLFPIFTMDTKCLFQFYFPYTHTCIFPFFFVFQEWVNHFV